jgi:hypothetical protein
LELYILKGLVFAVQCNGFKELNVCITDGMGWDPVTEGKIFILQAEIHPLKDHIKMDVP